MAGKRRQLPRDQEENHRRRERGAKGYNPEQVARLGTGPRLRAALLRQFSQIGR
ncbi:MAG: hypothetical protein NVSMB17_10590 [Candidatus Dormibacteria bacterium]